MARKKKRKNIGGGKIRWGRVLLIALLITVVAYAASRQAGMQWPIDPQVDRLLGQAQESLQENIPQLPEVPGIPTAQSGDIKVYFAPAEESARDGIDDHLVAFLNSAEQSIDAAFYELDFDAAAQALVAKHQGGVQVRLVTDEDYKDEAAFQACVAAGIPVVWDGRSGLMHNKFCVVDGEEIWTGSTNITLNGMFKNDNNALHIVSADLAENYTVEFEEMFIAKVFGKGGTRATPHPKVIVGVMPVLCYFSPDDGVEAAVLAVLEKAQRQIDFAAFSFTSVPIAEAMAKRMKSGVAVRGVFETRSAGSRYSRDEYLAERGAKIYLDSNPNTMHHKFIVVDGHWVITGSYNFSKNAEKSNDENVLILDDGEIAGQYLREVDRLCGGEDS